MSGPERLKPADLRTLFLFEQLDDDQLAWLAERGRVVEYPAGATIHAEGAPASCFMVLLSGVLARDIGSCRPGQAHYTLWCDDGGFVMEDGVVFRHAADDFVLGAPTRLSAAGV